MKKLCKNNNSQMNSVEAYAKCTCTSSACTSSCTKIWIFSSKIFGKGNIKNMNSMLH